MNYIFTNQNAVNKTPTGSKHLLKYLHVRSAGVQHGSHHGLHSLRRQDQEGAGELQ